MSKSNIPEGVRVWVTHYRDPEKIIDSRPADLPTRTPIIAATCVEFRSLEDENTVLAVGWAHCSEKDQFSKRKGRLIATNRAVKDYNRAFEGTQ